MHDNLQYEPSLLAIFESIDENNESDSEKLMEIIDAQLAEIHRLTESESEYADALAKHDFMDIIKE